MLKQCFIAAILFCCGRVFGQDSASISRTWTVSGSGYFQLTWVTLQQSFNLPYGKATLNASSGKDLQFHLELRPTGDNPLVKAYAGYSLTKNFSFLLGQLPNPMKWVEPEPEDKLFAYYALYPHYVANGDDIGVALYSKTAKLTYYGCVVNGTGRNVSDNNKAKDVAAYISYAPLHWLKLEAAGQTGQQPESSRTAGFTHVTFTPLTSLQFSTAAIQRTDLNDWGWYAASSYTIDSVKVFCRIHQVTQRDRSEFTVGVETGGTPLKLQLNTIIGPAKWPELVAVVQVLIK